MNAHRKVNKLLAAFALGELDGRRSSDVRAHLAECARCRDELGRLKALLRSAESCRAASADGATCAAARESLWEAVALREAAQAAAGWRHPLQLVRKTAAQPSFARFAVAATVVLAVIGVVHLASPGNGRAVVAAEETIGQLERAQAVTWKTTLYGLCTTLDGKHSWVNAETRRMAYKGGVRREEDVGPDGEVRWVEIQGNGRKLSWRTDGQTAHLSMNPVSPEPPGGEPEGPFAWIAKAMKEHPLEWVGKTALAGREVNVFRQAPQKGDTWAYDIWIDATSKQMVAYYGYDTEPYDPGAGIYDPTKAPMYGAAPVRNERYRQTGLCFVDHDIDLDAQLDDALFRFEPPEGYTLEVKGAPTVTEGDMVEYLRVIADFRGGTFPDQVLPFARTSEEINRVYDKPEDERTPAEQRLIDADMHYKMAGLNAMPVRHFIWEHVVEGSFVYIGKGVRLGDADRIVCWYKLRRTGGYRAVYGDLAVKDVAPEDLPLPVEP
jgi:hypothetical protein